MSPIWVVGVCLCVGLGLSTSVQQQTSGSNDMVVQDLEFFTFAGNLSGYVGTNQYLKMHLNLSVSGERATNHLQFSGPIFAHLYVEFHEVKIGVMARGHIKMKTFVDDALPIHIPLTTTKMFLTWLSAGFRSGVPMGGELYQAAHGILWHGVYKPDELTDAECSEILSKYIAQHESMFFRNLAEWAKPLQSSITPVLLHKQALRLWMDEFLNVTHHDEFIGWLDGTPQDANLLDLPCENDMGNLWHEHLFCQLVNANFYVNGYDFMARRQNWLQLGSSKYLTSALDSLYPGFFSKEIPHQLIGALINQYDSRDPDYTIFSSGRLLYMSLPPSVTSSILEDLGRQAPDVSTNLEDVELTGFSSFRATLTAVGNGQPFDISERPSVNDPTLLFTQDTHNAHAPPLPPSVNPTYAPTHVPTQHPIVSPTVAPTGMPSGPPTPVTFWRVKPNVAGPTTQPIFFSGNPEGSRFAVTDNNYQYYSHKTNTQKKAKNMKRSKKIQPASLNDVKDFSKHKNSHRAKNSNKVKNFHKAKTSYRVRHSTRRLGTRISTIDTEDHYNNTMGYGHFVTGFEQKWRTANYIANWGPPWRQSYFDLPSPALPTEAKFLASFNSIPVSLTERFNASSWDEAPAQVVPDDVEMRLCLPAHFEEPYREYYQNKIVRNQYWGTLKAPSLFTYHNFEGLPEIVQNLRQADLDSLIEKAHSPLLETIGHLAPFLSWCLADPDFGVLLSYLNVTLLGFNASGIPTTDFGDLVTAINNEAVYDGNGTSVCAKVKLEPDKTVLSVGLQFDKTDMIQLPEGMTGTDMHYTNGWGFITPMTAAQHEYGADLKLFATPTAAPSHSPTQAPTALPTPAPPTEAPAGNSPVSLLQHKKLRSVHHKIKSQRIQRNKNNKNNKNKMGNGAAVKAKGIV